VAAWPTETFTDKRKTPYLNDEGIEVIAVSAAQRRRRWCSPLDVIVSGGSSTSPVPGHRPRRGGSTDGEIAPQADRAGNS
jgi:hypothetical protein